jgi:hypothetical protein
MQTQAEAFVAHAKQVGLPAGEVVRDREAKYSKGFDAALEAGGARAIPAPFRSPNVNAYAERFVQAIGQECLDKLIVFGPDHLDHAAGEYLTYYHEGRPHQGKGNVPLTTPPVGEPTDGEVGCRERLGGLLRGTAPTIRLETGRTLGIVIAYAARNLPMLQRRPVGSVV